MPSSNKTHVSASVLADLGKLDKPIAQHVRDVAGADTRSTSIKGANTPVSPCDMAKKVAPHANIPEPFAGPPPMGSGKPVADWPRTRSSFQSGVAVRGRIG